MNYSKLKGRIVEKFGSQGRLAKHLEISEQTVTAKLNGRSRFTQEDIIAWCNALDIDAENVGDYFFAQILSKG